MSVSDENACERIVVVLIVVAAAYLRSQPLARSVRCVRVRVGPRGRMGPSAAAELMVNPLGPLGIELPGCCASMIVNAAIALFVLVRVLLPLARAIAREASIALGRGGAPAALREFSLRAAGDAVIEEGSRPGQGPRIECTDPATGDRICTAPDMSAGAVREKVARAPRRRSGRGAASRSGGRPCAGCWSTSSTTWGRFAR